MTAIGLILMVIGFLLLGLFGKPYAIDITTIEWIGGTCMLAGFIFFTAGVTVWLWQVMP